VRVADEVSSLMPQPPSHIKNLEWPFSQLQIDGLSLTVGSVSCHLFFVNHPCRPAETLWTWPILLLSLSGNREAVDMDAFNLLRLVISQPLHGSL